ADDKGKCAQRRGEWPGIGSAQSGAQLDSEGDPAGFRSAHAAEETAFRKGDGHFATMDCGRREMGRKGPDRSSFPETNSVRGDAAQLPASAGAGAVSRRETAGSGASQSDLRA